MIITCLIGDPVEHSVSPTMFSIYARKLEMEYSHVKFRVSPQNLGDAIKAIKSLNITGANITLPHKLDVIKHLDRLDISAKAIGAVNTILNKNGQLIGYNTDGIGAIKAIETKLKTVNEKDVVLVIGAGGAARAIIYELSKKTNNITVLNRTVDIGRAMQLKKDFLKFVNIRIDKLDKSNLIKYITYANIVINATPVGMYPKSSKTIVEEKILKEVNKISKIKNKLFFDAIFNPYLTLFLKISSKKYNAKVCSGLYMMLYQGVEAFKIWVGKDVSKADVVVAHNTLKEKLKG